MLSGGVSRQSLFESVTRSHQIAIGFLLFDGAKFRKYTNEPSVCVVFLPRHLWQRLMPMPLA